MGIKKPPPYVHPGKAKKPTAIAKPETLAPVENTEKPDKEKSNEAVRPQTTRKSAVVSAEDTVTIRLVANPPKAGEFELYDQMIASGLSKKQAVQALMRKGFQNLDAKQLKPAAYEADGVAIETNRTFATSDVFALKQRFDQFGILSKRALGLKIGEALLVKAIKESGDG